jgi:DNA repair exonuclease SbcCD ATPase subunit
MKHTLEDVSEMVAQSPELQEAIGALDAARREREELRERLRELAGRLMRMNVNVGDNRTGSSSQLEREIKQIEAQLEENADEVRRLRRLRAELLVPASQALAKMAEPEGKKLAAEALAHIGALRRIWSDFENLSRIGSGVFVSYADQAQAPGFCSPQFLSTGAVNSDSIRRVEYFCKRILGTME